jgi:hypothetical protein
MRHCSSSIDGLITYVDMMSHRAGMRRSLAIGMLCTRRAEHDTVTSRSGGGVTVRPCRDRRVLTGYLGVLCNQRQPIQRASVDRACWNHTSDAYRSLL